MEKLGNFHLSTFLRRPASICSDRVYSLQLLMLIRYQKTYFLPFKCRSNVLASVQFTNRQYLLAMYTICEHYAQVFCTRFQQRIFFTEGVTLITITICIRQKLYVLLRGKTSKEIENGTHYNLYHTMYIIGILSEPEVSTKYCLSTP